METLRVLLCVLILLAGTLYGVWFWGGYYRDFRVALQRWADAEGYEILLCERRRGHSGPFAWRTSRYQVVYYVVVTRHDDVRRTGWVRCGSTWGQNIDQVDVAWERG